MAENGLIGIKEFAKKVGVGRQTIDFHIRRGNLTVAQYTKNGKMLDEKFAMEQWSNRSALRSRQQKKEEGAPPPSPQPVSVAVDSDEPETMSMADAERQERVYKSKLAKLKFLEQSGKLLDIEKVKKSAYEMGRKTRDSLLAIPTRIAHELAAEVDPHKVDVMLSRELTKALEGLARGDKLLR